MTKIHCQRSPAHLQPMHRGNFRRRSQGNDRADGRRRKSNPTAHQGPTLIGHPLGPGAYLRGGAGGGGEECKDTTKLLTNWTHWIRSSHFFEIADDKNLGSASKRNGQRFSLSRDRFQDLDVQFSDQIMVKNAPSNIFPQLRGNNPPPRPGMCPPFFNAPGEVSIFRLLQKLVGQLS